MDDETKFRLGEINRRFYAERAAEFSATRDHPWPGWDELIPSLPKPSDGSGLRVLDVGCGNGRFGHFLLDRGVALTSYVGLDSSPGLLGLARTSLAERHAQACQLVQADLLAGEPNRNLSVGHFELVVAFGLLHHIPSHMGRRGLVQSMASRVAPGGQLVCTFWRFGESARFRARAVAWPEYNRDTRDAIDTSQLEAGDHLLGFGESSGPPRFCHHCDDDEIAALLDASELDVLTRFDADGRSGDLNHYAVMRRPV
jgi:tRNA (uracil-5-)-methyltransferase TRM9